MNNLKKAFIISSVFLGFILWQTNSWFYGKSDLLNNAYVVINKGNGSSAVASKLKDAGVIDKKWLFKLAARFLGLDKKLKAGEYVFEANISMHDALQKLTNGDIIYRKITLPEGLTSAQIINIINNEHSLMGDI